MKIGPKLLFKTRVRHKKYNTMKRLFVLTLVLCLSLAICVCFLDADLAAYRRAEKLQNIKIEALVRVQVKINNFLMHKILKQDQEMDDLKKSLELNL